jgi:hypothetical protein
MYHKVNLFGMKGENNCLAMDEWVFQPFFRKDGKKEFLKILFVLPIKV